MREFCTAAAAGAFGYTSLLSSCGHNFSLFTALILSKVRLSYRTSVCKIMLVISVEEDETTLSTSTNPSNETDYSWWLLVLRSLPSFFSVLVAHQLARGGRYTGQPRVLGSGCAARAHSAVWQSPTPTSPSHATRLSFFNF